MLPTAQPMARRCRRATGSTAHSPMRVRCRMARPAAAAAAAPPSARRRSRRWRLRRCRTRSAPSCMPSGRILTARGCKARRTATSNGSSAPQRASGASWTGTRRAAALLACRRIWCPLRPPRSCPQLPGHRHPSTAPPRRRAPTGAPPARRAPARRAASASCGCRLPASASTTCCPSTGTPPWCCCRRQPRARAHPVRWRACRTCTIPCAPTPSGCRSRRG
mmetsp:Transcript_17018/g.43620  ORF Transcript_17018/g.43620 Transcript_17018/m.43620 type:complete len:221 (-) Transcript_17018:519-1181(-)